MTEMESPVLYFAYSIPIFRSDIENALQKVGLKKGDSVMVHSDVGAFGKLGAITDRNDFLNEILKAFLNVLGPEGTLIVPTYTYSFCKGDVFEVTKSRPGTGIFSDYVWRQKGAFRSEDPIFSHAGIGKASKRLLEGVGNDCFGKDSFFDRFYEVDGKIMNFGKFFDITFLHYIENKFGVSYRYDKRFSGSIIGFDGRSRSTEMNYYVRALPEDGLNVEYAMPLLGDELLRRGLLKKEPLGANFVLCCRSKDCFNTGFEMLSVSESAFLKDNPYLLQFTNLPFHIGVLDSPDNKGLPVRLPFAVEFDERSSRIVSRYFPENEELIQQAYRIGSVASTNLGEGSFGVRRAEDALKNLLPVCDKSLAQTSFLEVGCADGYILHRLKLLGAREVTGCEPGPLGSVGKEKFGLNIINEFFKPGLFQKKFDVIFSYGVLEHIREPERFMSLLKEVLAENGTIFAAVPNCELRLQLGDIQMLGHEHWSYFTSQTLNNFFTVCGLTDVHGAVGQNNAMIYAWGRKAADEVPIPDRDASETKMLFRRFCSKATRALTRLQERIRQLEALGKTLGVYGGGFVVAGVLEHRGEPRFFDTDISCHGKYYAGFKNPIENPRNLLTDPVDELWIMAIDYDMEIRNYLRNELKVSGEIQVFSYRDFLEGL